MKADRDTLKALLNNELNDEMTEFIQFLINDLED